MGLTILKIYSPMLAVAALMIGVLGILGAIFFRRKRTIASSLGIIAVSLILGGSYFIYTTVQFQKRLSMERFGDILGLTDFRKKKYDAKVIFFGEIIKIEEEMLSRRFKQVKGITVKPALIIWRDADRLFDELSLSIISESEMIAPLSPWLDCFDCRINLKTGQRVMIYAGGTDSVWNLIHISEVENNQIKFPAWRGNESALIPTNTVQKLITAFFSKTELLRKKDIPPHLVKPCEDESGRIADIDEEWNHSDVGMGAGVAPRARLVRACKDRKKGWKVLCEKGGYATSYVLVDGNPDELSQPRVSISATFVELKCE